VSLIFPGMIGIQKKVLDKAFFICSNSNSFDNCIGD